MFRVNFFFCLSLSAMVFLPHGAAFSQVRDTDPVQFSIHLKEQYLDNRDTTELEKEDTFDTIIEPRIDILHQGERSELNFFYAPGFRYRSDPSDIQNDEDWLHALGLKATHKMSKRIDLRLFERLYVTDDPAIQEGGTTLRRDSSYILNSVVGGTTFEFTPTSDIDLSARHMIKRYDEPSIARESDEESVDGRGEVWHRFSRTVGVLAYGNGTSFQYGDDGAVNRDFTTVGGGLGLETALSPHLQGGVQVGWTELEFDDESLGTESAPHVQLRVNGSTVPSMRISTAVTYSLRDSDIYPYSSQRYSSFYTSVEWDATPNVTMGLAGEYRIGEYKTDSVPLLDQYLRDPDSLTPEQRQLVEGGSLDVAREDVPEGGVQAVDGDERTGIVRGMVGYSLGLNTSIRLIHKYEDVDSDVARSFTRNTTTLEFSQYF